MITDNVLKEYLNKEKPRLIKILNTLGIRFDNQIIIDVGAEIGLSAQTFKELGNENTKVIGYEINNDYCRNRLNVFNEYYCREMTIDEYLKYISSGFIIKMDCEGCESKYITIRLPEKAIICLHDWVPNHMDLGYMLIDNGYIPFFNSYDWHEICYIKLKQYSL